MEQVKEPEMEQSEKAVDLIPEERLKEILNILLPYGYSHYDGNKYTGVSPYIGDNYHHSKRSRRLWQRIRYLYGKIFGR